MYCGMRIAGINRRNKSPRISRPQATCISQRLDRAA